MFHFLSRNARSAHNSLAPMRLELLEPRILLTATPDGWWRMDGDVNDVSSHALAATVIGDANFQAGQFNQAISFDGGGDMVSISDPGHYLDNTSALTISAWLHVDPQGAGTQRGVLSKRTSAGDAGAYAIYLGNDDRLYINIAGGSSLVSTRTFLSEHDNSWYHIAVTFNSSDAKLYVNGAQEAAATAPQTTVYSSANLVLGALQTGSAAYGSYFNGKVDDLRITRDNLTGDEIALMYYSPVAYQQQRIVTDASELMAIIDGSDSLTQTIKNQYITELNGYITQAMSGSNIESDAFPTDNQVAARPLNETFNDLEAAVLGVQAKYWQHVYPGQNLVAWQDEGLWDPQRPMQQPGAEDQTLAGYWHFDENSGASSADVTGNGYDAELRTGAGFIAGGQAGYGVELDGLNDNIQIAYPSSDTTFEYTGGEMTLSTWIYADATETNGGYVISKAWNGSVEYNYKLHYGSGRVSFSLNGWQDGVWSQPGIVSSNTMLLDTEQWHHVAVTVDGATNAINLYLDGQKAANTVYHNITQWAPANGDENRPLVLGTVFPYHSSWSGNSIYSFDGRIDETRFYTSALTPEAIAQLADASVGQWRFDETSGADAADASGYGHDATLKEGAYFASTDHFNGWSVRLDGNNDYVEVNAASTDTSLEYTGGDMTASAWIYIEPTETTGGAILSKPWNNSGDYNYQLSLTSDNHLGFTIGGVSGGSWSTASVISPEALTTGGWHKVAATIKGDSNAMSLYVDGVEVASTTHTFSAWTPPGGDINLSLVLGTRSPHAGGWTGDASHSFSGRIGEARVETRATTDSILVDSLRVSAMKGEARSTAVNISNTTDDALFLYVNVDGIPAGVKRQVHYAEWLDENTTSKTGNPHGPLMEATYVSGKGYRVPILAGMTRQIWLMLEPDAHISAGEYAASVTVNGLLQSDNATQVASLNLKGTLRVSPIELMEQDAVSVGGWEYANLTRYAVTEDNRDAMIDLLDSRHVDIATANGSVMPIMANPTDFSAFDEWLNRWRDVARTTPRKLRVSFGVGPSMDGYAMGTAGFNEAVASWITAYAAHFREVGIDPRNVGLIMVDEPSPDRMVNGVLLSDIAVGWGKAIRAANTGVELVETMAHADPEEMAIPGDDNDIFEVVDTFIIHRAGTFLGDEDFSDFYRDLRDNHGKTIEFYSVWPSMPYRDTYSYHRLSSWSAFAEDAAATSWWSFADHGGIADWKQQYSISDHRSPIYLDPDTASDGIAMRSIMEGVQDYIYLRMAQDRIDNLVSKGFDMSAAQASLDLAVSTVLNAPNVTDDLEWDNGVDRSIADAQRQRILHLLETLPPTIDSEPVNHTVDAGQHATFVVHAAGNGLTYQWQYWTGSAWANVVADGTNASYTTPALTTNDHGKQYRVQVTNSYGTTTSDIVYGYINTQAVNDGLVGRWQFDQKADDRSGHEMAHHGELFNRPISFDGVFNDAMSFDGRNDYVQVSYDSSDQSLEYTGGDMTIAAWVYVNATEDDGGYILSKAWNNSGRYNYRLRLDSNKKVTFRLGGMVGGAWSEKTVTTSAALTAGQWHHVAAVIDGSSNAMMLYVDGLAASSPAVHNITSFTPTNGDQDTPLVMGALFPYGEGWSGNTGLGFEGRLDDVRIYDTALSASAIATQAQGMVANWQFDESGGTYAGDATGNGYGATLKIGAAITTSGHDGNAISFDGVNDHVQIAYNAADDNLEYTGGDLTLSTWAYINSTETTGGYLISKAWNNGTYNYRLFIDSSRRVHFRLDGYVNGVWTQQSIASSSALTSESWHKISATIDGSTNTLALYVDGQMVDSLVHSVTDFVPSSGDDNKALTLGTLYPYHDAWSGNTSYSFDGRLDDVQIYRRLLDESEL